MTPDEFRDTMNQQLLVYYPDTREWVAQLPDDTKSKWAEMFGTVEVRDLRAAIEVIVSDPEKMPRRELLATTLRVSAKRLEYQRIQKEESRQSQAAHDRRRIEQGGGLMERIGLGPIMRVQQRMIDRLSTERGTTKTSPERAYIVQLISSVTAYWFGEGISAERMNEQIGYEELEQLAFDVGRAVPSDRLRGMDEIRAHHAAGGG